MRDAETATTEAPPQAGRLSRRAALGFGAAALAGLAAPAALAQPVRFFRIAAGPIGGTMFPAAGWIAQAISNPPGSRPCERYGSCGVPGLIAMAQSTEGSIANIEALRAGTIDAALAYAATAHDARVGAGAFKTPFPTLCAIASLAPELVHVLVRRGGPVRTIGDLKGRRVAVGVEADGPAGVAEAVLKVHGIGSRRYRAVALNPDAAAGALASGEIDAMVFLARPPAAVARQMIADHGGVLLPLDPERMRAAIQTDPYLFVAEIPPDAYGAAAPAPTLATLPVLLVRADLDSALAAAMSRALWLAVKDADGDHPLDRQSFAAAQIGRRGVPLHPAAQAFRDELLKTGG